VEEQKQSYSEFRIRTGQSAAYFTPEAKCFFTGVIYIQKQAADIYYLHLKLPTKEKIQD
jgi:hypothetical protein